MSKITVKSNGGFPKLEKFFDNVSDAIQRIKLDKYGKMGVEALRAATPKDSGLTAESWYYVIEHDDIGGTFTINWYNNNIVDGWCNVAVLLQYGHATNNGGYVQGHDYINPALKPVFDKIAQDAWKEVTNS